MCGLRRFRRSGWKPNLRRQRRPSLRCLTFPADSHKLAIAKILQAHPHYKRFLIADRPAQVSEAEWAFLRAGVWPDWVRPSRNKPRPDEQELVRKYHKSDWHYVNLPYILPADA